MGTITIVKCPKCQREVRRQENSDNQTPGTPIRVCSHCKTEYYDQYYYEIALEQNPPEEPVKKSKWAMADYLSKKSTFDESDKRLSKYDYLLKLYQYNYLDHRPSAKESLCARILKHLMPYLDILEKKLGPVNKEYKLKNADDMFMRIVYDAKDEEAVKNVIREVLSHYGTDYTKYSLQIEYQEKELNKDGGTLGQFIQSSQFGGTIKTVLVPRYSEYDAVIAVILHECAHALLYSRMISLPNKDENERLTDIAAIYMGGGKYLQRGCFMYNSFHIGYLQQIECDLIANEVEKRRAKALEKEKQDILARDESIKQIEMQLSSIQNLNAFIHPGRVVREKGIVLDSYQFMSEWEEKQNMIASTVKKMKKEPIHPENIQSEINNLEQFRSWLNMHDEILTEWQLCEEYQTKISPNRLNLYRDISNIAEKGNIFAKLEMIQFWAECSGTIKDAKAYLEQVMKNESEPDALYILGVCKVSGYIIEKNEQEGYSYLCKAASLGSHEAATWLGE